MKILNLQKKSVLENTTFFQKLKALQKNALKKCNVTRFPKM